ncbi:MAG: DUF6391 domain-containing protein [Anaerolineae bacterium]|jgi:hypothetical protein
MAILNMIQAVRQNHALEHATMHVLSAHDPFVHLVGRSSVSGFYIYGPVETEALAAAAGEALARLQQGEAHLAVHPRCGTNLVVTSVLAGTAAFAATVGGRPRSKADRFPLALVGATVAALVAQPLGLQVQEHLTTTPEIDGLFIESVTRQERGSLIVHKVAVGRE